MYIPSTILYMILSKTSIDIRREFWCFGKISHDIVIPLGFSCYTVEESGIYIPIGDRKKYHLRRFFNEDGTFDISWEYVNILVKPPGDSCWPDIIHKTSDFFLYRSEPSICIGMYSGRR